MPEAIVRGANAAPQLDEARAFEEQLTMHGRDGLRLARFLPFFFVVKPVMP